MNHKKFLPFFLLGAASIPTIYCSINDNFDNLPQKEQIRYLEESLEDFGFSHAQNRPAPFQEIPHVSTSINYPCQYSLKIGTYRPSEELDFNFRKSIDIESKKSSWTYQGDLIPKSRFIIAGEGLEHTKSNKENHYVEVDKVVKTEYKDFHQKAKQVCTHKF